jgi:hypothetical protein
MGSSRKLSRLVYAVSCMSIRLALLTVASPSHESADLADPARKTPAWMASGGCGSSYAPQTSLFLYREMNFRQMILGNSTSFERNKDSRSK